MSEKVFNLAYSYGPKHLYAEIIKTAKGMYHLHAVRKDERIATHKMDAVEYQTFMDELYERYDHPMSDFNSVFALHNYACCGTFDTDAPCISENVEVQKKTTKKGSKKIRKAAKALVEEIRNLTAEEIEDLDDYQGCSGLPIHVGLSLFEGKIDELEIGAGHQDGAFWFDVDTTKSDRGMREEIIDLIELAHELTVDAENGNY